MWLRVQFIEIGTLFSVGELDAFSTSSCAFFMENKKQKLTLAIYPTKMLARESPSLLFF